jgi:hypothetical protein
MDDCSGNVLQELIRKYYFNKMPKDLALDLEKRNLEPDFIKTSCIKRRTHVLSYFCQILIQHRIMNCVVKSFERNEKL